MREIFIVCTVWLISPNWSLSIRREPDSFFTAHVSELEQTLLYLSTDLTFIYFFSSMSHSVSSLFISLSSFPASSSVEQRMWGRMPSSLFFHAKLNQPQSPSHWRSFNKDFGIQFSSSFCLLFLCAAVQCVITHMMIRQRRLINCKLTQRHSWDDHINPNFNSFWGKFSCPSCWAGALSFRRGPYIKGHSSIRSSFCSYFYY